jgi:hypothetical protein
VDEDDLFEVVAYTDGLDSRLRGVWASALHYRSAQVRLYAAVDEALRAGHSAREVARKSGLSHTGVQKTAARWPEQAAELGLVLVDERWWFRRGDEDLIRDRLTDGMGELPDGD